VLVLTRRLNERIKIGQDIEIVITEIKPDSVKIGIVAPKHVEIFRSEVYEAIEQANLAAARGTESLNNVKELLLRLPTNIKD